MYTNSIYININGHAYGKWGHAKEIGIYLFTFHMVYIIGLRKENIILK